MSDLSEWRYRVAEISTQDADGAELPVFQQYRVRLEVFRASAPEQVYSQWVLRGVDEYYGGVTAPYAAKVADLMRGSAANIVKTLRAIEVAQAQVGQVCDVAQR